jgi:hypothetical protein
MNTSAPPTGVLTVWLKPNAVGSIGSGGLRMVDGMVGLSLCARFQGKLRLDLTS